MSIVPYGPTGLRLASSGRVASDVNVTVVRPNTNDLAPLQDADGNAISNPIRTDSRGNLFFHIEEGSYDLLVNGARIPIDVEPGARGLSAYDLAVQQGFQGTLDEWLASLGTEITNLPSSKITGEITINLPNLGEPLVLPYGGPDNYFTLDVFFSSVYNAVAELQNNATTKIVHDQTTPAAQWVVEDIYEYSNVTVFIDREEVDVDVYYDPISYRLIINLTAPYAGVAVVT